MRSRFLNKRANRLTEALDGAMATHISSASVPDQAKAVLALIQSDECVDAMYEAAHRAMPADERNIVPNRHEIVTACQAALIAYLTADALTKEADDG